MVRLQTQRMQASTVARSCKRHGGSLDLSSAGHSFETASKTQSKRFQVVLLLLNMLEVRLQLVTVQTLSVEMHRIYAYKPGPVANFWQSRTSRNEEKEQRSTQQVVKSSKIPAGSIQYSINRL